MARFVFRLLLLILLAVQAFQSGLGEMPGAREPIVVAGGALAPGRIYVALREGYLYAIGEGRN